jgi:hypothetical protein
MEDSVNGLHGQHAIELVELALKQELERVQIQCQHIMAEIVPGVIERL